MERGIFVLPGASKEARLAPSRSTSHREGKKLFQLSSYTVSAISAGSQLHCGFQTITWREQSIFFSVLKFAFLGSHLAYGMAASAYTVVQSRAGFRALTRLTFFLCMYLRAFLIYQSYVKNSAAVALIHPSTRWSKEEGSSRR